MTVESTTMSIEDELNAFLSGEDMDLSDLEENPAPATDPVAEEPAVAVASSAELADDDMAALLDELEAEEPVVAAAEESAPEVKEPGTPAPVTAPEKKDVTAKAKKRAPRVSTAGMEPSEAFAHKFGDDLEQYRMTAEDTDLEANKARLHASCDALAKKVKDKAVNMQAFRVRGEALSVYTEIAVRLLVEKGEMTTADLKNAYMTATPKAYTSGTANAQCGQMFQLLPAFEIAEKADSKTLVLKADNVAVAKFRSIYLDK